MQHWLNESPREEPWSGVARLGGAADSKRGDPKGKIWYGDGLVLEVAVMADAFLCRSADPTAHGVNDGRIGGWLGVVVVG